MTTQLRLHTFSISAFLKIKSELDTIAYPTLKGEINTLSYKYIQMKLLQLN